MYPAVHFGTALQLSMQFWGSAHGAKRGGGECLFYLLEIHGLGPKGHGETEIQKTVPQAPGESCSTLGSASASEFCLVLLASSLADFFTYTKDQGPKGQKSFLGWILKLPILQHVQFDFPVNPRLMNRRVSLLVGVHQCPSLLEEPCTP